MLEHRLKLIELIDREGFYGYHLAEHHSTPLGLVPSPSVLIAAAIQRTKRIRIGPLVYVLPLYHPLRLVEEICMLDHMSNGRLMLGVGRGATLFEHQRYGIDPAQSPAMYHEAYAVMMRAFESDVLNFEGQFYNYKDYLVLAKPVQRPHPPVWYGAPDAQAVGWAAPNSVNVVSLGPASRAKEIAERYRKDWAALGRAAADLPMIGITRHVVVAATDREAKDLARRVYPRWRDAIEFLWVRSGIPFKLPQIYFERISTVSRALAMALPARLRQCAPICTSSGRSTINYVLCQMAFGDMTYDEAANSIGLFARKVTPALSAPVRARGFLAVPTALSHGPLHA